MFLCRSGRFFFSGLLPCPVFRPPALLCFSPPARGSRSNFSAGGFGSVSGWRPPALFPASCPVPLLASCLPPEIWLKMVDNPGPVVYYGLAFNNLFSFPACNGRVFYFRLCGFLRCRRGCGCPSLDFFQTLGVLFYFLLRRFGWFYFPGNELSFIFGYIEH